MKIILENKPYRTWSGEIFTITVRQTSYANKRTALIAHCIDKNGLVEPFTKMSVNIPEVNIDNDEIIIKDHDENDGVLAFLYAWDIVSAPIKYAESDMAKYPICKLLV